MMSNIPSDLLLVLVASMVNTETTSSMNFLTNILTVSVTRAKALLIIVGDPNVLGLDPLWRQFLNYIYLNSGWKGPPIPWDPTEPVDQAGMYDLQARDTALLDMNEFTRRMEALTIEGTDEDLDAGVDRPWRELE